MKTANKIRYAETGMKHKSLYCFITFYKFSVTELLMPKGLNKLFIRTMLMQELISYTIPIPLMLIFVLFYFRVGKTNTVFLLTVASAGSVITLLLGIALKYYYMRPMLASIKLLSNNERDENLFRKAKINTYRLPFADGIFVFIRWSVLATLMVNVPLLLTHREGLIEFAVLAVLMTSIGLISMPIYYLIAERQLIAFNSLKEITEIELNKKPVSLGLVTKIRLTIILSFLYPVGNLISLMYMIINNYMDIKSSKTGLWLILAVTMILAVIITELLTKTIKSSLDSISKTTELTLQGDLTNRVNLEIRDEVGQTIKAFNIILDYMVEMLSKIKKTADSMQKATNDISAVVEETNATNEELAAGTEVIKENSIEVSEHVKQTYNKSMDISEMTKKSLEYSQEVESSSKKVSGAIALGKNTVEIMTSIIENTSANSLATNETMDILFKKTKEIQSILDVIKGISEQTNLLALNSAIEAARAGEAGKGFAVVANEIKKLAERSNSESSNIEKALADILTESDKSKSAIDKTVQDIDHIKHEASKILGQFNNISENMQGLVEVSGSMYANSKTQETLAEEMIASMDKSYKLVLDISERITEADSAIGQGASTTQEAVYSIENLSLIAEEISEYLLKFKIS